MWSLQIKPWMFYIWTCLDHMLLVVVDDFSRYTWTLFLASKNDAYKAFKKLAKVLHNENENRIKQIHSDHGGEFQNAKFDRYCEKHGITHSYSASRTPQQNGVVERKNRSFEELARTMLNESGLPNIKFQNDRLCDACVKGK